MITKTINIVSFRAVLFTIAFINCFYTLTTIASPVLLSELSKNDTSLINKYDINKSINVNALRNNNVDKKYNKNTNKYYFNVIIIKTKNDETISFNNKSFNNTALNQALSCIDITSIRRKYPCFQLEKYKASDNYGLGRIYEIAYTTKIDPLRVKELLSNCREIEYSCPSYKHEPCMVPNDSAFAYQTELAYLEAEKAYNISKGSPETVIAIVDTEVDWEHEDLATNIWQNPGETGTDGSGNDKRANGIDDDGNGKIDDWHGWDFADATTWEEINSGIIHEDNDTKIRDSNSTRNHGTFTASNASAVTNNSKGIASTGYSCSILPIKVRSDVSDIFLANEGLVYAGLMKANIVNCSWTGLGYTEEERDIVRYVDSRGCLIVAAVGNSAYLIDADDSFYNNYHEVLYVGASDQKDNPAGFSNHGIAVSVYAPGEQVLCAVPYNKYMRFDGTSMSSPVVAGIAGLVKSLHPDWTNYQVRHQIRSTADRKFYNENNDSAALYYGRANAYKSLKYNIKLDSAETVPGIENLSYTVKNTDGIINSYTYNELRLHLRNYLSTAQNLSITAVALDDKLEVLDTAHIQTFPLLRDTIVTLNVKLTNNAKWYHKSSKLLLKFKANDYVDYQMLMLSIAPLPEKKITVEVKIVDSVDNIEVNKEKCYINSISAANVNTLWVTGSTSKNNLFVAIYTTYGLKYIKILNQFLNYRYPEITAANGKVALLKCYDTIDRSRLFRTVNSGESWELIVPDSSLSDIIEIKCHDNNAMMTAQGMFMPYSRVMYSTDYGKSWSNPDLNPDTGTEHYMEASISFHGSNRWFSSYQGYLYHSKDFGRQWEKFMLAERCFAKKTAFPDDHVGYALIETFSPDSIFFAVTGDGGETWDYHRNVDFEDMGSSTEVLCAPQPDSLVIVTLTDNSTIFSEPPDYSWHPVTFHGVNNPFSASRYYSDQAQDGRKTRIWYASNTIYYADFDNYFEPQDTSKTDNNLLYFLSYPNPASGNLRLQFYLNRESNVTIDVYDLNGRLQKRIFNNKVLQHQYETVIWNSDYLSTGSYYYKINIDGEIHVEKFMIVN